MFFEMCSGERGSRPWAVLANERLQESELEQKVVEAKLLLCVPHPLARCESRNVRFES